LHHQSITRRKSRKFVDGVHLRDVTCPAATADGFNSVQRNFPQTRMANEPPTSTPVPLFSIIIGAYNDWAALTSCLRSFAQQTSPPSFEVILVDDGSAELAPDFIRDWNNHYPLTIVRQTHAGVSAARNCGAQISKGPILLFADADSRFDVNCLQALASTIANSPQHNSFQLRLTGDCATLVGRVEELRLITLQDHLLQPDGCLRYLNTAGFAIRRTQVNVEAGVFYTGAVRGEDTLLLAGLIARGQLPFLVANAIVQHETPFSLIESLRKEIRSAYLEMDTYKIIDAKGVKYRVTHRERLEMLRAMWKTSGRKSIGRCAWFVLVTRQVLRLALHLVYRMFPKHSNSKVSTSGRLGT
jgi:glycosyltransferase involved in cell wall biosynthesis